MESGWKLLKIDTQHVKQRFRYIHRQISLDLNLETPARETFYYNTAICPIRYIYRYIDIL